MLEIKDHHKQYFEEVKAFAEKIGKWDVPDDPHCLKRNLDFLADYSGYVTKCELYPDRPMGFGFVMYQAIRDWECMACQHVWKHAVTRSQHTPNLSGEPLQPCLKCSSRGTIGKPVEWKVWFNGGLLYHGSHDGFGSGAGPTFAVTLSPTDGWSIHT